MSAKPPGEPAAERENSHCLTRSVVSALADDPTLEAVTIDRNRRTISVATLGRADVPKVTARIRATFQHAQESQARRRCTLLAGEGDCDNCVEPLSELQRRKITIRHDGDRTTIA